MNNELGRKITSLTLMAIMVAGGMTFAVPGVMPAAHAANANLFVSAENSQFENYMTGAQVIEVVVIDGDIKDTDEAKGEPDVTLNGEKLAMAQATDGNWYAYFAGETAAKAADNSAPMCQGLDFGTITDGAGNVQTEATAIATPVDCDDVHGDDHDGINVLRETKDLNTGANGRNIAALNGAEWPLIQLFELNPTGNVVIQYNKAGGAQSTTLTYDTVDGFAGLELDRSAYPQGSQVHATVTDVWLNIDPTDEDSWTWDTESGATYYQVFDENGDDSGNDAARSDDASDVPDIMFEDSKLILTLGQQGNIVIELQDNDNADVYNDNNDPKSDKLTGKEDFKNPVTLTEQGPNSGVFGTYDEADKSILVITDDAKRGTSATIDYNDTPTSVIVRHGFATIDIQPLTEEWSSGEVAPVVLVDTDANKNSRVDEDLTLSSPDTALIPSLSTGDPITLIDGTKFLTIPGSFDIQLHSSTRVGSVSFDSTMVVDPTDSTMVVDPTDSTMVVDPTDSTGVTGTLETESSTDNPRFIGTLEVEKFSERALLTADERIGSLVVDLDIDFKEFKDSVDNPHSGDFHGINLLNIDLRSFSDASSVDVWLVLAENDDQLIGGINHKVIMLADGEPLQSLVALNDPLDKTVNSDVTESIFSTPDGSAVGLLFEFDSAHSAEGTLPFVADFFSFGFSGDGISASDRTANQIIRLELEEDADNSSTFVGSLEYVMLNQLNILDSDTYGIDAISDAASFIVMEDLTDEDSPRVTYLDLGADGVSTQISTQEEAPSHSGIVTLDLDTYKQADTVTVTLTDSDLNVDSDLVDIFTVVTDELDPAFDNVGKAGLPDDFSFGPLGVLLNITFDDELWKQPVNGTKAVMGTDKDAADYDHCPELVDYFADNAYNTGLGNTGFTLIETESASGVFVGDFQIPNIYCQASSGDAVSVTGTDIEVNYVDFRDASGEIIEVGDSAGVRANTGSVSLDRTVYPVPWGTIENFGGDTGAGTTRTLSVFPVHSAGIDGIIDDEHRVLGNVQETLGDGELTIHVRINDPDFDISASGEDTIGQDRSDKDPRGPLKITISRGADRVVLAYAGGATEQAGVIDVGDDAQSNDYADIRLLGAITEVAPDAGIFELDFGIKYTDGPASSTCPDTTDYDSLVGDGLSKNVLDRFDVAPAPGEDYCILQGDIITVEYTDPTDASGDPNTVTDSATFDLRNGVLQSDKSVYIIGGDMILTVIEPDWDLDNDAAETYDLDVIEWDSDAAGLSMGDLGGEAAAFDPEPTDFRETGDSTGIFQIVIEIPQALEGDNLERGEEITLEYTDWGPSGSDYVGQEDEDINLTVFTSNFGATIDLDQKVYSWTDKVYITIVAPDHNFDSNLIDEIGETSHDPIKVATGEGELDQYKLVETGVDTGIFTGEVILTGFPHNADGDTSTGDDSGYDTNPRTGSATNDSTIGLGPTDGFLESEDEDGISVSFEFSDSETVVGTALIRWNIGEAQWLEASYPAAGQGVLRIIDPDMNIDPEAVDNFEVDVKSDSDGGGIDLTVTETNEATGIFEGTVTFTVTDESSGHRLRVSEGDTVTAEYEDNTLPDPSNTSDDLDIRATTLIGTIVPPLERVPLSNMRVTDTFENTLDSVSVDQQVEVVVDLVNTQDKEQEFAYIVQVQDANGVTVKLEWIKGALSPGQAFSPAISWIPSAAGTYTATAFAWESVNNPTALSPQIEIPITAN